MPAVIVPLNAEPDTIAALAEMLIEVVANGGSVSFMHPLAPADATAFWTRSLAAAAAGERIVLGAFEDDGLVASVRRDDTRCDALSGLNLSLWNKNLLTDSGAFCRCIFGNSRNEADHLARDDVQRFIDGRHKGCDRIAQSFLQ